MWKSHLFIMPYQKIFNVLQINIEYENTSKLFTHLVKENLNLIIHPKCRKNKSAKNRWNKSKNHSYQFNNTLAHLNNSERLPRQTSLHKWSADSWKWLVGVCVKINGEILSCGCGNGFSSDGTIFLKKGEQDSCIN